MASKKVAKDLGEDGFMGAYNIGPSAPEAQGGHVGPLDPVGMLRNPRSLDRLGYLPEGRSANPPKPKGVTRRER